MSLEYVEDKKNKSFVINGALRKKKGSIILTVYSNPFARFLKEKSVRRVNTTFDDDTFIIKPGNKFSVHIERVKENHPLCCISVTKLIDDITKKRINESKHQIKSRIMIRGFLSPKQLNNYNNQTAYVEPKNIDFKIPSIEKIKVGCHISCFRNKKGFNYRFNIRHRILEEIAIKKEKVNLYRNGKGEFIIRKDPNGNSFNLYKNAKGHVLVYMQMTPSLIRENENSLFRKGRRCFSSRAYLSSKEFELDVSKFFMNRYEKELAYALLSSNINVRIPEMRKREADIVLKDNNIQIEVTNLIPRKGENHKNSPHTEGMHINGRICEGFLRVTKGLTPHYFVVFNRLWDKYKWVSDLIRLVKPKVTCITTDFCLGWEKKVASKIKEGLQMRGELSDRI